MNKDMNKTEKIKEIDTEKINDYLSEQPKSKLLKEIIKYSKRALDQQWRRKSI